MLHIHLIYIYIHRILSHGVTFLSHERAIIIFRYVDFIRRLAKFHTASVVGVTLITVKIIISRSSPKITLC